MRVFDHCPANFWREAAAATVTISTNDSVRPSAASLPCHRNNSETTVRHPLFPSAYCLSFSSPMLLLPCFPGRADGFVSLIPFHGAVPRPSGRFGISSVSSLYFFPCFPSRLSQLAQDDSPGAGTPQRAGRACPFSISSPAAVAWRDAAFFSTVTVIFIVK